MNFNGTLAKKQAVDEILKCNEYTIEYGLGLTHKQAIELVEERSRCLKENGRVELGGGIIHKIINEFCDSPYIHRGNYEETLHFLLSMFYYYKSESLDTVTDDDLICYMHKSFDGVCQGSLELLGSRELERMAKNIRFGYAQDYSEDEDLKDEADEEDEYGEY